ncbi:protein FAR1-RELATED SEQUENCE 5-like [Malus sylvestris]|uniref:protein FAR1-RELATED SEQUENCE 5-like n=1 Tax=Malus sylvestris TaxID=3752 RepID=UPI0021AC468F|nr:protein FAR1-RELATED SEQUENCE 5-like [Malus sylvestris]
MEHQDDEFHTPSSRDAKEAVDCIHLDSDSDSETFEVLDQNEEKGEFTSKVGDISLGMTFDNEDDAYNYYNAYARRVGFSVRKNRENKDSIKFPFIKVTTINRVFLRKIDRSNAFCRTTVISNLLILYHRSMRDFKRCIYDPETIEEFESNWDKLLDDYELRRNDWLEGRYLLREKWAQVYGRDHFCAGMTTTQRIESMNKFLKKYFARNLLLQEFVIPYGRAIADRKEKERQAENATKQKWRSLYSDWNVEIEASKQYTSKIFYYFQEEVKKVLNLRPLKLESDDGLTRTYTVMNSRKRGINRTLIYDLANQIVLCSCKKFEFEGILCAHALKLYYDLDLSSIPSNYYLKRWSKDAKCGIGFDSYGEPAVSNLDSSSLVQYSELSNIAQRIIAKGAKNSQNCSFLKSELLKLEKKMEKHANFGEQDDVNYVKHMTEAKKNLKIQDPKVQKSKGRGKGRMKSALESNQPKKKGPYKRKG